jgi:uncharacterized protein (TIGR03085 family)
MTSMAKTERARLCDLALQVGQDEPTLCGDWTVKELVVHLLIREGSPAAVGITVSQLSGLTDLASRRLADREFTVLVERLRSGPPLYSPFRIAKLDAMFNTLEYFVHHEDIHRAQPTWDARELSAREQKLLWKQISVGGKGLVRAAKVGVVLERSDNGEQVVLKPGDPSVVVRGLPSELVLYVFGRRDQADVELVGRAEDVAALSGTDLGV